MAEYGKSENGMYLRAYNAWICLKTKDGYIEGGRYWFHEDAGMYGDPDWGLCVDEEDYPVKQLIRPQDPDQ